MTTASLLSGRVCLRCSIKGVQGHGRASMRHVSRTSAINRGLRATKSPAFGDRRRAERASASGRDGRDERASSGGRDGRDRREARVPAFDRASKGPAFGDQRRPERVKAPGRDGRDQRPERTSSFGSGGRDRRESSAPALDRGFRESKGQAFGDRRRPERASSSTRNGRDRGASRQSSFSPRMSTQSDVAPRTGPRAEEEDDRPLAFRKRDSPEPRQSTRDEKRSSSRTTDDASGEKGSYNDWLTSKRSDREKRSDGIRARQEENFARKRDQTQQQDVRSKDKKHHVRGDARTSHPSEARPRKHRDEEEDDDDDGIPDAIPYTTASSQFLYGTNPVLAALRAKRRQLYTLHLRKERRPRRGARSRKNAGPQDQVPRPIARTGQDERRPPSQRRRARSVIHPSAYSPRPGQSEPG